MGLIGGAFVRVFREKEVRLRTEEPRNRERIQQPEGSAIEGDTRTDGQADRRGKELWKRREKEGLSDGWHNFSMTGYDYPDASKCNVGGSICSFYCYLRLED